MQTKVVLPLLLILLASNYFPHATAAKKVILAYAGSFNPIHNGHLRTIEKGVEAINAVLDEQGQHEFQVNEVFITPAAGSYKKSSGGGKKKAIGNEEHRLEMIRRSLPSLKDDVRGLVTVTPMSAKTGLGLFWKVLAKDTKLFVLLGDDYLDPDKLPTNYFLFFDVAIATRDKTLDEAQKFVEENFLKYKKKILLFQNDASVKTCSSSSIKKDIMDSNPISGVPGPVREYIEEHELYGYKKSTL